MGKEVQSLIPGLPEDIALDCLARIPHQFHPNIRSVCRSWRDLVTAPFFLHHRKRIGYAEDLIFLIQSLVEEDSTSSSKEEENKIYNLTIYNATLDTWHRGGSVPMFSQIAAAEDGKVVVVGGWDPVTFDPVSTVHVIDLLKGERREGKPMSSARSFFACGAAHGKVYVAGGHDGQKNAMRSSEVYDVAEDEWLEMPDMEEERDECRGVVTGGRFWAVSGYRTENQGRFDSTGEWFDLEIGRWRKEDGVLLDGEIGAAAWFGLGEGIWCVEVGRGVREYNNYIGREKGWRVVGHVPDGVRSSTCAAVIGGGERVFVMGGGGGGGGGSGGGNCGWVMDVKSCKWIRVETPVEFSGFVYSAAAVRI